MKSCQKVSKISAVVYLLALVMIGFAGDQIYACYTYVASIVEQGFVISESLWDVINYYMTNVTPYVFYACCLWGLGFLIQKVYEVAQILNVAASSVEDTILVDEYQELQEVIETQDMIL